MIGFAIFGWGLALTLPFAILLYKVWGWALNGDEADRAARAARQNTGTPPAEFEPIS